MFKRQPLIMGTPSKAFAKHGSALSKVKIEYDC